VVAPVRYDKSRQLIAGYSVPDPFHILQEYLLAAAVIKFRGAAVDMAGDALSGFKGAVIFQKIRDAGRAERMR